MKLADNLDLIRILSSGGIAVIRTDTLYGLVASANNQSAVERVFRVKDRDPSKSCIILIDSAASVYGSPALPASILESPVEMPTSFLIDGAGSPSWLLRTNSELAYRIPLGDDLRALLAKTGPLIAPSANPEGSPPACSIQEAKVYFGEGVDVYIDGGTVPQDTPPSRLLRIHADGSEERLR